MVNEIFKSGSINANVAATSSMYKTSIKFTTQDNGTAKLIFNITKDGGPLPLSTAATAKIFLRMADGSVFEKVGTITDRINGQVEHILKEELNHPGNVEGNLNVYFSNGQSMTICKFSFFIEKTLKDQNIVPLAEYYVKDFESLRQLLEGNLEESAVEYNAKVDTIIQAVKGQQTEVNSMAAAIRDQRNRLDAETAESISAQVMESSRQTETIEYGLSVLKGNNKAPVDIEIEGRTLVNMSNSNLTGDKKYVLADKKTKVIVDNNVISGVGKFTKNNTFTRKANFVGKTTNNTTGNPHFAKSNSTKTDTVLVTPNSSSLGEYVAGYSNISTLGNGVATITTTANLSIAQTVFSFDLIEEIERNMGIIPGATRAAKTQWIKDNLSSYTLNWHGFGSGPNGNKVTLTRWAAQTSSYFSSATSTNASVTKLSTGSANGNEIDADGYVHFLAYAEPSNGTIASVVNTDFVELQIDLKPTAQLDTRPAIVKVANFEGKVSGSTVESPHVSKYRFNSALQTPTQFVLELTNASGPTDYGRMTLLGDAPTVNIGGGTSGDMAQQLFAFDIIAEVERKIGRIPASTTALKVSWLRANFKELRFAWYGFGTSPTGNKATLRMWGNGTYFVTSMTHTSAAPQKLSISTQLSIGIADDGYAYFTVHAEPSSGAIPSAIMTDYAELELEMKPTADFQDPIIPLYEVDDSEYKKILVEWDEAKVLERYPAVQGVQHIQNPYVIAEGDNIIPPFYEWTIHSNARIISPYSLELVATSPYNNSYVKVNVIPGQTYTLSATNSGRLTVRRDSMDNGATLVFIDFQTIQPQSKSFVIPSDVKEIWIRYDNYVGSTLGTYNVSNPMLTLGNVERPFVPRNPSYLFAQTKLGQIETNKDRLFKQDGAWKVQKLVEKDVFIDGSLNFNNTTSAQNQTGYKEVGVNYFLNSNVKDNNPSIMYNFLGQKMTQSGTMIENAYYIWSGNGGSLYIRTSNVLTGFGQAYLPLRDEWKAYFNGWQAKTVDGAGKPTAWRSLGNGTDAPTQTLAYVSANMAPGFTPYKLSYLLVTPKVEDVSDKVEGDITVSGLTQIEVGSGVIVREKAIITTYQTNKFINAEIIGKLNNRSNKIMAIYKNGVRDNKWFLDILQSYPNKEVVLGSRYARIDEKDFDATAEYTVTYQVQDKNLFTVTPYNVKATFAKNIRNALDDTVQRVEDNTTNISGLIQSMTEFYKRLKALGG
ncbi:BppU family phage baseplate upper protein [Peribacillus frigoritolerans]|uniref:BppU family phage baseplate upper protein n=1 Tax=Peribacillus frigoritolerans TaxID=450367 RepID=UPI003305BFA3